jgi:hypothetical protein
LKAAPGGRIEEQSEGADGFVDIAPATACNAGGMCLLKTRLNRSPMESSMTTISNGQAIGRQELMVRLRRVHGIARLMDTAIRIPGTGIRFGADSVLGLIPGIGDAGGALVGLVIVNEARRLGVPNQLLLKMLANIGLDTVGGSVPVIGDLFDVYFKSNWRNMQLLLAHFEMDEAELFSSRRRR